MSDFTYELVKHIAVLSENGKTWRKELNLIKWGNNKPKYDLRVWMPEGMGKGMSLTLNELSFVVETLQKHLNILTQSQVGTLLGNSKYRCELCCECGVISRKENGWTIELNIVKWSKNNPCFDLRSWGPTKSIWGKGITLTHSEAKTLIEASNSLGIQGTNGRSALTPINDLNDPDIVGLINDLFI